MLVVVVVDMTFDRKARMAVAGRAAFVKGPVDMDMVFMEAVGVRVHCVRRPVRVVRRAVMGRQVLVKVNRHERKCRRQEADGGDEESDAAVRRHDPECIPAVATVFGNCPRFH